MMRFFVALIPWLSESREICDKARVGPCLPLSGQLGVEIARHLCRFMAHPSLCSFFIDVGIIEERRKGYRKSYAVKCTGIHPSADLQFFGICFRGRGHSRPFQDRGSSDPTTDGSRIQLLGIRLRSPWSMCADALWNPKSEPTVEARRCWSCELLPLSFLVRGQSPRCGCFLRGQNTRPPIPILPDRSFSGVRRRLRFSE